MLAVLVVVPLGIGGERRTAGMRGAEPTPPFEPMVYAPTLWVPAHANPNMPASALLRIILARFGPNNIVSAEVGSPPEWARQPAPAIPGDSAPAPLPPQARWIYFTAATPRLGPDSIRGIWEAQLVAGALWDELYFSGTPEYLVNSSVEFRLPDGQIVDAHVNVGKGNAAHGQLFSVGPPEVIMAPIRSAAHVAGLQVIDLTVMTPAQAAPALVVATHDPNAFVAAAPTVTEKLFGASRKFEGYYLEARDATTGRPVYIEATSFRLATARLWIRPDLDAETRELVAPDIPSQPTP